MQDYRYDTIQKTHKVLLDLGRTNVTSTVGLLRIFTFLKYNVRWNALNLLYLKIQMTKHLFLYYVIYNFDHRV